MHFGTSDAEQIHVLRTTTLVSRARAPEKTQMYARSLIPTSDGVRSF